LRRHEKKLGNELASVYNRGQLLVFVDFAVAAVYRSAPFEHSLLRLYQLSVYRVL
jgi:hypothetical protein